MGSTLDPWSARLPTPQGVAPEDNASPGLQHQAGLFLWLLGPVLFLGYIEEMLGAEVLALGGGPGVLSLLSQKPLRTPERQVAHAWASS